MRQFLLHGLCSFLWVDQSSLPGSYQRLDLFIKVLRVLCPNLTDATNPLLMGHKLWFVGGSTADGTYSSLNLDQSLDVDLDRVGGPP